MQLKVILGVAMATRHTLDYRGKQQKRLLDRVNHPPTPHSPSDLATNPRKHLS